MTIVNGATTGSTNVFSVDEIAGLNAGDIVSLSTTKLVVNTSPGPVVTFTGTGFGYDLSGIVSGTLTGLTLQDQGSASMTTWSGFSVSAPTVWADVQADDISAIYTLFFGGNDTFTSNSPFESHPTGDHANYFDGFGGNDTFNMQISEGDDQVVGANGNDTFNFGADFTTRDIISGGIGTDTLNLAGDYSAGVQFGTRTVTTVEKINLAAGDSYKLITNDTTVASGATLTVNGSLLGTTNSLIFNGTKETNGIFVITGGAGKDTLTGGAGADHFTGGGGADHITGGAGADHFIYTAASDSTGLTFDNVTGFDALSDKFDVPGTIAGVDTAITTGALSGATFNANLVAAVNSDVLAAHHAVEFTPNSGALAGDHFLIVDLNGKAGYQANADLVIELSSPVNITHLGTADFI